MDPLKNWPAPNSYGFVAQLVEHCTGIAEVTGSNPAEAWIFFQASLSQLLKLRINREDLS